MRQQFTESPQQGVWGRLRGSVRRGGFQIATGASLIILIALAGIAGSLYTEQLNTGDPSEGYHPPHNSILQDLLYRPSNRIDTVRQSKDVAPFQMGASATIREGRQSSADSDTSVPRITSIPSYTAVVGQTYEYNVEAGAGSENVSFELGNRPSGMTIDAESGLIRWTPQRITEKKVEARVFNANGKGTKQTFTVHVSSASYPLGTEKWGRGMGAALLLGARWALLPGCVAVLVSMILGVLAGGLAGYYEGSVRSALTYVSSVTEAVPSLVIFFIAAVIFQGNIFWIMGVVGLLRFPRVANAVKSKVQSLKARQFVEASRELGLQERSILWRNIIWYNARPQLLLQASYGFVFAIIVEVTLSYLRLGIEYPTVSWGNLLFAGREQLIYHMYWPTVIPALAIILAVTAFYLLADGIARWYEIKGA